MNFPLLIIWKDKNNLRKKKQKNTKKYLGRGKNMGEIHRGNLQGGFS